MPHNWLRLFNRLIQPNVSFSERELAVWGTASSQGVPAPTLGLFCRSDGATLLASCGSYFPSAFARSIAAVMALSRSVYRSTDCVFLLTTQSVP